ncbi:MAG: HAD family hydrolase [Paracoccaceae bacterium]|nr:HAD family hydrolase [Paracoccaceae bacterium]
MQYKGLLFDKDGTLFDFQKTWGGWVDSSIRHLSEGDAGLADALADALDFDMERKLARPGSIVIAGTLGEVAGVMAAVLRTDLRELAMRLDATAAELVPVPAAPLAELMTSFRSNNLKLGVATNDSEAAAIAHLERSGIDHFFDYVAGYDSGYGGKPGPGMCVAFAERLSLPPEQVVMVGDSTHDMQAGRAAGMACVAVLTGVAGEADLAPYADAVLPDIGHLPNWLAKL